EGRRLTGVITPDPIRSPSLALQRHIQGRRDATDGTDAQLTYRRMPARTLRLDYGRRFALLGHLGLLFGIQPHPPLAIVATSSHALQICLLFGLSRRALIA